MVLAISLLAVFGFLVVPLAMGTRGAATSSRPPALFRRRRPGIHSGRDRVHPALRLVSWTSRLRADRSGIPAAAFERRGQHGFPMVAGRDQAHMADPPRDCRCIAALRCHLAGPAEPAGWLAFPAKLLVSAAIADPAGFRYGHAVPDRTPGPGRRISEISTSRKTEQSQIWWPRIQPPRIWWSGLGR